MMDTNERNNCNEMTTDNLLSELSKCLKPMRGTEFNVFHWIRLRWDEVDHSGLIKSLLNSEGIHDFEDKFLVLFLNELEKIDLGAIQKLNFQTKGSSAVTEQYAPLASEKEKKTKEGRIDIYIKTKDKKKAIIIENKLLAKDQPEQLVRYDKWADRKLGKGNYVIVYLTMDGKEASENSCVNGNGDTIHYIRISYQKTIIEWLNACIAKIDEEGKDESHMRLRLGIKQYIEYLDRRVLKASVLEELLDKYHSQIKEIIETNMEFPDRDTITKLYEEYNKKRLAPLNNQISSQKQ